MVDAHAVVVGWNGEVGEGVGLDTFGQRGVRDGSVGDGEGRGGGGGRGVFGSPGEEGGGGGGDGGEAVGCYWVVGGVGHICELFIYIYMGYVFIIFGISYLFRRFFVRGGVKPGEICVYIFFSHDIVCTMISLS